MATKIDIKNKKLYPPYVFLTYEKRDVHLRRVYYGGWIGYQRWAGAWEIGIEIKDGILYAKSDRKELLQLNGKKLYKSTKAKYLSDNKSSMNRSFYGTDEIDLAQDIK